VLDYVYWMESDFEIHIIAQRRCKRVRGADAYFPDDHKITYIEYNQRSLSLLIT
jgi:hypothetical protein